MYYRSGTGVQCFSETRVSGLHFCRW